MQKKRIYVVAGGTFDHFHIGHELFLKTAIEAGDYLAIGITADKMVQNKPLFGSIEPFSIRKAAIRQYIRKLNPHISIRLMKLNEPFGIAVVDKNIDKIIVTKETKANAILINKIRRKNRLKALKVLVVPYVNADDNRKISSYRIRNGQISRHGDSYIKFLISKRIYVLPDVVRPALREPLGHVFSTKNEMDILAKSVRSGLGKTKQRTIFISVGDIVSLSLMERKLTPSIMIYDYITRREALSENQKKQLQNKTNITVFNQAGVIRQSAIKTIFKTINKVQKTDNKIGIRVIGEEDLMVLPTILMAPLYSKVFYGQKDLGFIAVTVTETVKEKVKGLMQLFQ